MLKLWLLLALGSAFVITAESKNVVCYFASWTIYRPGNGKFTALDVDPNLCTHVIYAFVGLGEDGSVTVLDDWELTGLEELTHLQNLKQQNGNLKLLVSMGGWNENSGKYSRVIGDAGLRDAMVNNVINFVTQNGFDGFDLDWEYPNQRGGVPADVDNFITVLGQLKSALNSRGLILSAAVSGGKASSDLSYRISDVSNNLDLINIMTYDFHGAFEDFIGHYAPLYGSSADQTDDEKTLNVAFGLQYWLDQGADPSKINLGVGSYGRGFRLTDPSHANLYDATAGACAAGPYTRQEGIVGYNEICELYSGWQYVWDDEQQVPHITNGQEWIGYDDTRSIEAKVNFANSKNLGGIMLWALDTDDFAGVCGERYPLLNTIKRTLG